MSISTIDAKNHIRAYPAMNKPTTGQDQGTHGGRAMRLQNAYLQSSAQNRKRCRISSSQPNLLRSCGLEQLRCHGVEPSAFFAGSMDRCHALRNGLLIRRLRVTARTAQRWSTESREIPEPGEPLITSYNFHRVVEQARRQRIPASFNLSPNLGTMPVERNGLSPSHWVPIPLFRKGRCPAC